MRVLFVVVSGAPGSGKSTIARELAPRLGLPLIAKDTIKEALAESLGVTDLEGSRRMGKAAIDVMFALAKDNASCVFESAWVPEFTRTRLADLGHRIVEVFCSVPVAVAIQRYEDRAASRHWSHFDLDRVHSRDAFEAYNVPVGGDWPMVKVDTTRPVDVDVLAKQVLTA